MPTLHLDAGDLWQAEYTIADAKLPEVEATAAIFLEAYKTLGVRAVAVGDRDLALGVPRLLALSKKASFAFLSVNVLKDGAPVFKPSVLETVGAFKVGIIGATTALFMTKDARQTTDGITIVEPAELIAKEAEALKAAGASTVIVLGHLNKAEVDLVTAASKHVSLVLGGQWLEYDELVGRSGDASVLGGFQRGKHVSVVSAFVKDGSFAFVDRDAKAGLERRVASLKGQITGRTSMMANAKKDPAQKDTLTFLEQNLVQLKTDLQTAEMDLEDLKEPDPKAPFITWENRPIDQALADEEALAKRIAKHRETYPDPTKPKTPPLPAKPH